MGGIQDIYFIQGIRNIIQWFYLPIFIGDLLNNFHSDRGVLDLKTTTYPYSHSYCKFPAPNGAGIASDVVVCVVATGRFS